ncbi:hypothetical protein HD553DRAFT_64409 [Filobasidium floriforme]|uniref:uncharacterized protein n=1 Tax=Filobasidium floriforme TaxID=5210 RepID=UPI001E8E66A2|nr:uncharacterized protein HD553DRAFT_64409 [Filobasidium floriforme]KAH8082706.1 hypothetical protein HD553DRAFT_64409 [Filobasidium floriforme]
MPDVVPQAGARPKKQNWNCLHCKTKNTPVRREIQSQFSAQPTTNADTLKPRRLTVQCSCESAPYSTCRRQAVECVSTGQTVKHVKAEDPGRYRDAHSSGGTVNPNRDGAYLGRGGHMGHVGESDMYKIMQWRYLERQAKDIGKPFITATTQWLIHDPRTLGLFLNRPLLNSPSTPKTHAAALRCSLCGYRPVGDQLRALELHAAGCVYGIEQFSDDDIPADIIGLQDGLSARESNANGVPVSDTVPI